MQSTSTAIGKPKPSAFVVYLVSIFYTFCGLLVLFSEHSHWSLLSEAIASLAIIGGFGALIRQSWSAYIFLIIAFLVVAKLSFYQIGFLLTAGVPEVAKLTGMMLLFNAMIAFGVLASAYLVFRYFDSRESRN